MRTKSDRLFIRTITFNLRASEAIQQSKQTVLQKACLQHETCTHFLHRTPHKPVDCWQLFSLAKKVWLDLPIIPTSGQPKAGRRYCRRPIDLLNRKSKIWDLNSGDIFELRINCTLRISTRSVNSGLRYKQSFSRRQITPGDHSQNESTWHADHQDSCIGNSEEDTRTDESHRKDFVYNSHSFSKSLGEKGKS